MTDVNADKEAVERAVGRLFLDNVILTVRAARLAEELDEARRSKETPDAA